MDPQSSPPKSAIPRRGPPLTAIRTDIAQQHQQQQQQRQRPVLQKPRPQRLRPTEAVANQSQSVPLQSEPAKRQTSKTSLRSLFARNKALRDEKKQEVSLPAVGERRGSTTPSTHVPDTPRSVAYTVASGSTFPTSSQVPTPTESTFRTEKPSREKAKPEPKSKVSSSWVPPPLFQAYPQATKYARLSIPNISADSILRIQAAQGSSNFQKGEVDGPDSEAAGKNKKDAKDKKTNKRAGSSALDQIVLLRKIFVLVTAGYLLQYSGEGNFDRLPEKVMRLGSTSAAFASDAIPGKPYVVQISQKSTDDGKAPATSGRTFLSRFGLQGAESRRTVRTFLVIMANPQEMNAWLVTLRKTIESLGGKKYVPEDENEAPEFPGNLLLNSRNSRLLASRKPSLKDSNPPSPSSDTFQLRSPAPSVHRKNSYQDEISIKAANRRSLTAQSDAISISTTTTAFAESDVIFENPREPPIPSRRVKITPSSPPSRPLPPPHTTIQAPASASRQLRKPTSSSSVASNGNRRSLIASSTTQPDRQGEPARKPSLGRPLSFTSNAPESSNGSAQTTTVHGSSSRLSMLRKNSIPTIPSDDKDSRRTSTIESSPLASSEAHERAPSSKIEDSTSTTRGKRQSLVSPSQGATLTGIGIRIPPRKYSLTGPDNSGTTPRYNRPSQSPDLGSAPRIPQALPQQSQSRLPSVASKGGRPLNRLPKLSTESEMSASSGSNLARFALGNDRASKVPAATVTTREIQPSRSVPTLNHQTRKIASSSTNANVNSGSDEQQQGPLSKTPTPASSPQTPGTPREESSRRSSLIMPPSQQTSPRQRRIQNLSLLPPAPPPNCPLPEVPVNIARHLPLSQKRQQQQQQSQPQSQPQSSQQTQLPRPSLSSTSSTPSSIPPPRSSSTTPNAHIRRRSSELRRLHQQMANILNRKHSDISIPAPSSSSSSAAAVADPSHNTNHTPSESPLRNQSGERI